MSVYRRNIPMLITLLIGLFIIVTYFFTVPSYISETVSTITGWASIIIALSTGIGFIILLRSKLRIVMKREINIEWICSIIIVVSMFILPIISITYGRNSAIFATLYDNINNNIGLSIYGLVPFALTGAFYRAFRIRNWYGVVILVTAFLMIFQLAPVGSVIWSGFTPIGTWIKDVPMKAGLRGLIIASAFGLIAIAYRTLTGHELKFGMEEE